MVDPVIKIILVDDHAVVREGYRRLIEKHSDLIVAGEAAEGMEAYQLYKELQPDVVVLDISMPGKGGIEVIRHIRKWDEEARILIFTMHQNAVFALQAFQAGAMGYVTKSSAPSELIDAIRDVHKGRKAISSEMSQMIAIAHLNNETVPLESLTVREFDIFRMIAEAHSTAEIADTLNLSMKTISNYHYQIKSKLGVSSDIELAYLALRLKIVDTGSDLDEAK